LTTAAKGIAEIITVPGYVNVDFEDVNTVMRDSGVAVMGTAALEGDERARRAVEAALQSPLLEDSDIKGAKHILLNISSGTREVTMDEIFEITEYVQEEAGQGTDLIWGNCFDESLGEKLSVTVIATGFNNNKKDTLTRSTTNENLNSGNDKKVGPQIEKPQIRVDLDDEDDFRNSLSKMDNDKKNEGQPKIYNESVESNTKETERKESTGNHQKLKTSAFKLDNPELISELENQPAYLRKGLKLDNVEHSSEKNLSRWVVSDNSAPEIKDSNSYLHDNVD